MRREFHVRFCERAAVQIHRATHRGLTNNYDHFTLVGTSLGALNDRYPDWGQAFWEHLGVAVQLHHVKKIVLDHRDCGAYRLLLGEDLAHDPIRETEVHAARMRALRQAVNGKHSDLETELLLMALDGSVEPIA